MFYWRLTIVSNQTDNGASIDEIDGGEDDEYTMVLVLWKCLKHL